MKLKRPWKDQKSKKKIFDDLTEMYKNRKYEKKRELENAYGIFADILHVLYRTKIVNLKNGEFRKNR